MILRTKLKIGLPKTRKFLTLDKLHVTLHFIKSLFNNVYYQHFVMRLEQYSGTKIILMKTIRMARDKLQPSIVCDLKLKLISDRQLDGNKNQVSRKTWHIKSPF